MKQILLCVALAAVGCTAPPEPDEAPMGDPQREVAPVALPPESAAPIATAASTIAAWSQRSEAVAVFRVVRAEAFATDTPPFISTRYTLAVERGLAGTAPVTVVLPGGTLGETTALASELPRLAVDGRYLGVFWPGAQLVFAPPMRDRDHVSIEREDVAVDAVPAMVRAGKGGAS